jgi:Na+/proline symporter
MGSFSAWTFTGAAGLAYNYGLIVLLMYFANAGTNLIAAWKFAPWFRQLRAVTVMEAVRQRLGRGNEQVFTWLQIPTQILVAGIWLYGLAIFLSPVFKLDLTTNIILCGGIVIILSTLGGSWGIAASDFMQALLLLPITILVAWFAVEKAGGPATLLGNLPASHFDITASDIRGYGFLWLTALFIDKLFLSNRLTYAGRFFFVADSVSARRAALFAAGLFLLGSFLWFVPPLATRSLGIDLAARFPGLSSPGESAYAAIAIETLPPGLLGLLVTGIIAATLSSMDEGLNRNAGIFTRSVYLPLMRSKASERELVVVGKIATVVTGFLVVLLALKYSTWRDYGVLKLMFNLTAMVATPAGVPVFWCLFTKRSPDWAAWSTVLVGFAISGALGVLTRQVWFESWVQSHGLGDAIVWLHDNEYGAITILVLVGCSLWFWGATWFAKPPDPERQREIDDFFKTMHTPVTPEESRGDRVDDTPKRIARLCFIYTAFLAAITLAPNSPRGRLGLLFCALFFVSVGLVLRRLAQRQAGGATPTSTSKAS